MKPTPKNLRWIKPGVYAWVARDFGVLALLKVGPGTPFWLGRVKFVGVAERIPLERVFRTEEEAKGYITKQKAS